MSKPSLAVWKLASCDGCQLTLLDCEDELLTLPGVVTIAHFLEASSAVRPGPYDISLVEGSITTARDAERIREIREQSRILVTIGACATAGGIQALRNFGDVGGVHRGGLRQPGIHRHAGHLHPGRGARAGRLRAARLPDRPPPAPRGADRIPGRAQAGHPRYQRVHRVQAPGPDVRDGRGRDAVPRAGHARRMRRAVPRPVPRLLRLLRPGDRGERAGPGQPAAAGAGWARTPSAGCSPPSTPPPPASQTGTAMSHRSRKLVVSGLARVEGEGALRVTVRDGQVERAELNIYEPPRFFEAFLRGRSYTEPPDITSRICGICPVAYQTSACNAIEQACGAELDPPLAELRRLLYCGEWISSHALHIYLLHAPDFLGYPDAIALAREHRDIVERGLALKKAGNAVMEFLGGRAIHPVNVRVGGFYRVPTPSEFAPLAEQLRRALELALETARWVATFDFPDLELRPRPPRPPRSRPLPHRTRHPGHHRRAGVHPQRVPQPCHRAAGPALHRAARHPGRASLPHRPAGPVLAQLRLPVLRRQAGRGRCGPWPAVPQPVPQRRRPRRRDHLRRRGSAPDH